LRIIFLINLITLLLIARENPFESIMNVKKNGITTNEIPKKDFLTTEKISLPDSARKLKTVTIEYQNLDGSIDKKIVKLNKDIDWHFPINITHDIIKPEEKPVDKKKGDEKYIKVNNDLAFSIQDNGFEIFTKDSLVREFALSEPMKIVCDFSKSGSYTTKTYYLKFAPFVKVTLGNHADFYRLAIELDGQYKYKLSKTDYGYKIDVE